MPLLIASAIVSLLLSLFTALWADAVLPGNPITLIAPFFDLRYSLNPGIALGIRLPAGLQELCIGLALLAVFWLAKSTARTRLSYIAFGIVLGGGIANIIDRLRDGFVTDFIRIGWYPIFNIADSFVTVGVLLLLIEALPLKKRKY